MHLAYRDAGEPGRAADALEAYLAEAPADMDNRVNLEARVETLRAQAQSQGAGESAGPEVAEGGGSGVLA